MWNSDAYELTREHKIVGWCTMLGIMLAYGGFIVCCWVVAGVDLKKLF